MGCLLSLIVPGPVLRRPVWVPLGSLGSRFRCSFGSLLPIIGNCINGKPVKPGLGIDYLRGIYLETH